MSLFRTTNDPSELHNLIEQPEHRDTVKELTHRLQDWEQGSGTSGRCPHAGVAFQSINREPMALRRNVRLRSA